MNQYVFENIADQAPDRFTVLEECYDPVSRAQLMRTGVGPGWRCLEVGGGGGSMGAWLADAVGSTGQVVVTDVEPGRMHDLRHRENVQVWRHDITHDPLPEGEFDLVHARLVLLHLPQREDVLPRLVRALRPGGYLLLEDFDCGHVPVLAAPGQSEAALFERVHEALMDQLRAAGADPLWGRKLFAALTASGLDGVSATTYAEAWRGGETGVRLHHANTEQLRARLHARHVTEEDLQAFWALLQDRRFAVASYPLISARGRLPVGRPEARS
ncbi:class I SAM-dependent methyltransferase [Streptomyces lydicamycinicus]